MSFDYIRVDDILAIHVDQIARYGGGEGIRDPGLLEAALFRPQTGYYPTLIDEAAALWESLSLNDPFVDGNKRTAFAATAFAATYVFLAINGLEITATDDEAQDFVLGLYAASSITFDNLRAWLGEITKAL
ncbi:type II toxin-antitoxin system death-on-curing family toxin [Pseudomonadales bacterium]|nr:type II toxin-antitoxin system death-on-curing family toxin [Pseudomonadales bacterium]